MTKAPALWGSTLSMALGMGVLMLLGSVSTWLLHRPGIRKIRESHG